MAKDNPRELEGVNATGVGDQDKRDSEGGNNSRGVLDQTRPTGIMVNSRKGATMRSELKGRETGRETKGR